MDRIYLLDTDDLTQYGFIHANVEEDILLNSIWRVQETQIQPILGTPLFLKLKDEIKAWAIAGVGSGDYYDLWKNYVIPVIIPLTEIKVSFHITSEIENKGVGTNRDEYMTTNSVAQNNNLRDEIRKDATHFRNQLIKHLCDDDGTLYPEYKDRTGNKEDIKPEDSNPDYEDKMFIM